MAQRNCLQQRRITNVRPLLFGKEAKGFTLVEVLVSMIIAMAFLIVTMQIFVSAAYLRARANQFNDSYNWIQEDFEQVLTKAKSYEMQASPYSAQCNTGTLASGFIADANIGLDGANANLGTRQFGGKTFQLLRTASNIGTLDETRLVTVNYTLTDSVTGDTLLDIDTKVTIYAAFNCPTP